MGHVVNPLAFRLGKVIFWKYNYYHHIKTLFSKHYFLSQQLFNFCSWLFRDNSLNFFLQRIKRLTKKNFLLLINISLSLLFKPKHNKRLKFISVTNIEKSYFLLNYYKVFLKFFYKSFNNLTFNLNLLILPLKNFSFLNKNFKTYFKLISLQFFFKLKFRKKFKYQSNLEYFKYLLSLKRVRIKTKFKLKKLYALKLKSLSSKFFTRTFLAKFFSLHYSLLFSNLRYLNYCVLRKKLNKNLLKIRKFYTIKRFFLVKVKDEAFLKLKRKLFFKRKHFNFRFINIKTKPYGSEILLNNIFTEKINNLLINYLNRWFFRLLKLYKFRFSLLIKYSKSIVKLFLPKPYFSSELSTFNSFISGYKVKLNLFLSNNDLFNFIKFPFIVVQLNKKKNLKNYLKILVKLFNFIFFTFFFLSSNFIGLFYLNIYVLKYYYRIFKKVKKKKKIIFHYLYLIKLHFFAFFKLKFSNYNSFSTKISLNSFLFFILLNKIESHHLKYFFNRLFKPYQFSFKLHLLNYSLLNAQLIFKFIFKQLNKNKSLLRVIGVLLVEIKKQKNLSGFKILTCGRFTRKERAFFKVWTFNKLPFSAVTAHLDYFAGNFKSKFGLCSLRIWLFKHKHV